jgi:predicted outer membrane protein
MSQRTIFASLACRLLICATVAFGQNQTPPTQTPRAPGNAPQRDPAITAPRADTDKTAHPTGNDTFLSKAIESNMAEVELGKLASKKAQNPRVKSYADMLVKDHSAALAKLQKLHTAKVTVSPEHQNLKTKLNGLSGAQFDREYIDAMVSGHREAVALFEQQIGTNAPSPTTTTSTASGRPSTTTPGTSTNTTPGREAVSNTASSARNSANNVNDTARELLPTIKHHLEEGEQIQKGLSQPAK